jgi:hypothetical protein
MKLWIGVLGLCHANIRNGSASDGGVEAPVSCDRGLTLAARQASTIPSDSSNCCFITFAPLASI